MPRNLGYVIFSLNMIFWKCLFNDLHMCACQAGVKCCKCFICKADGAYAELALHDSPSAILPLNITFTACH